MRIAGVGRPAIVVQVDVSQLGMRLVQEVLKGAADGGVAGVEDEAGLALQLLELGERALQRSDDARVAGEGTAAVVGVCHVGERPDLGGRLVVLPVDLYRVPPRRTDCDRRPGASSQGEACLCSRGSRPGGRDRRAARVTARAACYTPA